MSCGSFPSGSVNAGALQTLEAAGISTAGLVSQASEAFEQAPPDIVITVCDRAAGETCPVFFGPALKAHWGLCDPSAVRGSEAQIEAAFQATLATIERRVRAFFALAPDRLDASALSTALARIGTL